jgi:hypothetical protein
LAQEKVMTQQATVGAGPAPENLTPDERVWVRHPTKLPSACEPIALPTASQPEMRWRAEACDISAGGIGLAVERRFEKGSTLIVELRSRHGGVHTLTVTVVHVRPRERGWVLGCQWATPFTEKELEAFLPSPGSAG